MAKHKLQVSLEGLTFEQYLAYAAKAAEVLKWTITFVSESGMKMESPFSWQKNTYGEEITLKLQDNQDIEITSESKGNVLIDFGRNRKNITALLEQIEIFKNSSSPIEIEAIGQNITNVMVKGDEDVFNPDSYAAREEKKWWSLLIPSKDFFITPIIIDLNILLFIAMVISSKSFETLFLPSSETLLKWGSNYKPLTLSGEWWRLFTCMFEHIGVLHLFLNMYALIYIGMFLEPLLGKLKFSVAYIVTGLAASLSSLWWHDNVNSAGASGAIFGMYGVFLGLLLTDLIEKESRKALLRSIGIFIVLNLLIGTKSGIDNAAHIGGLLSGIICGLIMIFSIKKKDNIGLQALTIGFLTAAIALTIAFTLPRLNNPVGEYSKILSEFSSLETEALNVYELSDSTPANILAQKVQNTTIPNFRKCRELVNKLEKIKLPAEFSSRVTLLKQYVNERIQEAELREKAYSQGTDQYNEQINEKVNNINKIIGELNN